MALDVQTIKPKTTRCNLRVLAIVNMFFSYVRAKAIRDERTEIVARSLVEEQVLVLGLMELLLSEGEPSMVGDVAINLTDMLGIDKMQAFAFHL